MSQKQAGRALSFRGCGTKPCGRRACNPVTPKRDLRSCVAPAGWLRGSDSRTAGRGAIAGPREALRPAVGTACEKSERQGRKAKEKDRHEKKKTVTSCEACKSTETKTAPQTISATGVGLAAAQDSDTSLTRRAVRAHVARWNRRFAVNSAASASAEIPVPDSAPSRQRFAR